MGQTVQGWLQFDSIPSCCIPHWSTFLHPNLRGPAKPKASGKGRMWGAFLHVQALGRQAPAQASAVLGPPNPGAREASEQSSVPCDTCLAAAPGRIRSQPKRRNLWRKDFSSCVYLCCGWVAGWVGGPQPLSPSTACVSSGSGKTQGRDGGRLQSGPLHRCYVDSPEGGQGEGSSTPFYNLQT